MGYSRSSASAWGGYTSSTSTKDYGDLYKNRSGVHGSKRLDDYNPAKITIRESRDSDVNPESTPIIMGLDATGSMSPVLTAAMKGLGELFTYIYDKRPVTDPHVMAMIFQDVAAGDRVPLEVTQFESDIVITEQLSKLYIEPGGGANMTESYHLPLYFALTRTDCDAFKKGRKGFLFTIGDESVPPPLTPAQLKEVFGDDADVGSESLSYGQLYQMASENWHVFHVLVKQGTNYRRQNDEEWRAEIGQHLIPLDDINALSEVIVATMQVVAGEDAAAVASGFSDSKAVAVREAVKGLTKFGGAGGVSRL